MKLSFAKTALATILCLAALGGVTAVVFLGNTSDGTIGIVATAGEIGVDVLDSVSGESIVGKTLDFVCPEGETRVLFAPGVCISTYGFKIKNTGDVPINFRLSISEDEKVDIEEFRRAFEFWLTTDPERLDDAARLTEFKLSEPLAVGETTDETFYLVVKMKEDAGNGFMNKEYSGIGITVFAVQGNPTPGVGE